MDKRVTIYGSSDDLIEIEGAIEDEFNVSGDHSHCLAFSDGTLLEIIYTNAGFWRISVITKGTLTSYDKTEATNTQTDYTDRLTLIGNIKWVALATKYTMLKSENALV